MELDEGGGGVSSSRSTYPHVVVPGSGCQASFAVWFEVGRIDRGILVMPIDDKRSAFHGGI